jgi:hypothetical protein
VKLKFSDLFIIEKMERKKKDNFMWLIVLGVVVCFLYLIMRK